MKQVFLIIALLFCMLMAGCSDTGNVESQSSTFVGKWNNKAYSLEIKRNGNSFILVMHRGKEAPKEYPAVLKGDVLIISTGLGDVPISHVKEDDTLLTDGKRFTRQQ